VLARSPIAFTSTHKLAYLILLMRLVVAVIFVFFIVRLRVIRFENEKQLAPLNEQRRRVVPAKACVTVVLHCVAGEFFAIITNGANTF
jgi:hypothetical protein